MTIFEDSTINRWVQQPGPIELRKSERVDVRRRQLRGAEGVLKWCLGTFVVVEWIAIILWAWLR